MVFCEEHGGDDDHGDVEDDGEDYVNWRRAVGGAEPAAGFDEEV